MDIWSVGGYGPTLCWVTSGLVFTPLGPSVVRGEGKPEQGPTGHAGL